jgi:hypothetical protein
MSNRFKRSGYDKEIDGDIWKLRNISAGERNSIMESKEYVEENPLKVANDVLCKIIVEVPESIKSEYSEETGNDFKIEPECLNELPIPIYDVLVMEAMKNVGVEQTTEKK